jgi:hypothetical protein
MVPGQYFLLLFHRLMNVDLVCFLCIKEYHIPQYVALSYEVELGPFS